MRAAVDSSVSWVSNWGSGKERGEGIGRRRRVRVWNSDAAEATAAKKKKKRRYLGGDSIRERRRFGCGMEIGERRGKIL